MPKVESWGKYDYAPHGLARTPAKRAPFDQTNVNPSSTGGTQGKLGGLGEKVSGGGMNGGGKRRPGHNARKGID